MSSPDWLMCVDRCMMICEPLTWPGNVAALNDSLGLRDDEMMTRVSFVAPVELSAQENA